MSKKLIGILAGVSLFGAGAAFANEGQAGKDEQAQTADQTQELGTGGSGQQGQEQQLTGKVVKAQGNKVFIEHMGAVVELKTSGQTQFEGDVKKARDLKEGDEIRASFTVKNKTENEATSISRTGTGGSGFEDLGTGGELDNTEPLPGSEPLPGTEPLPESTPTTPSDPGMTPEPGTGGSGMEGSGIESGTPDTMGTEPTQELPIESSPDTSGQPVDESSSGTMVE